MNQQARIKLTAASVPQINEAISEIKDIVGKTGIRVKGPTHLPVKRLNVVTRKISHGKNVKTYEKWEMRMHRRIIDLSADDKAIRQLMRLKIPDDVYIELSLK